VVDDAAAKLERYVESQFPQGVRVERALVSSEDVMGEVLRFPPGGMI
jgi:hypothetical protein